PAGPAYVSRQHGNQALSALKVSTDNRKRVKGGGRYTPFGMKLTVPASYGRFGDERGRLTLVRSGSAIPGRAWRVRIRLAGDGGNCGVSRAPGRRGAADRWDDRLARGGGPPGDHRRGD